jgi:hypothetical protein
MLLTVTTRPDPAARSFTLDVIANRHHYVGPRDGQPLCQTEPQTAIGAGNYSESAPQIRHVKRQIGLHHVTGKLVAAVGQRVMFERKLFERHGELQRRDAAQQGGQDDL